MPQTRNFSPQVYWDMLAAHNEPQLSFRGSTQADWMAWHAEAQPRFLELLGEFPERVPLNAEVESAVEEGDLIRERVVFDSEWIDGRVAMSVPCQVLRPKAMKADGSHAPSCSTLRLRASCLREPIRTRQSRNFRQTIRPWSPPGSTTLKGIP